MPPKPSHTVTGTDHTAAISVDWSKCMGCNMCTMKCTYGVLKKHQVKTPPFVTPLVPHPTQENTDTTRVLISESTCIGCGQCSTVCNFGAITVNNHLDRVLEAKKAGKKLVALIAPATRIGITEAMGMPIGTSAMAQLVVSLRQVGFDDVFAINAVADKTTMDDMAEIVEMKKEGKGPAFTSCCPGWIELLEKEYPDLIPRVSTARSPVACHGALVKKVWAKEAGIPEEQVYVVGIMPCVAKKVESARPQLHADYDASLTTNEIAAYFKKTLAPEDCKFTAEREEELAKTEEGQCDLPFRARSGGACIFAKTAGVAETVLRVLVKNAGEEWDPSKIKAEEMFKDAASGSAMTKLTIPIGGGEVTGVICHGGYATRKACDMVRAGELPVDVVEVMACVGGCQNGGGQPKVPPAKKAELAKRTAILDELDQKSEFKAANENTEVLGYIDTHLTPEEQHHFLHTHYEARLPKEE